jgi:crotonobetainyl-CoA:carnitine CoA-transferase CaiB-like acyl-CoA transferase
VVVQGAGGILSITGELGGPPVRPGTSGDIAAGLYMSVGILAALRERERPTRPVHRCSMLTPGRDPL